LTWAGPWACRPGKTQDGQKVAVHELWVQKKPRPWPIPARSLEETFGISAAGVTAISNSSSFLFPSHSFPRPTLKK